MSVSGQAGYVSYAIQPAGKIGSGTFDPSSVNWLNHYALGADVGFQQFTDQIPPELGGGLFTKGSFKSGAYAAGGMQLQGRLKDSLGHLLFATAGHAAVGRAQVASTDSGSTKFAVDPNDDTKLPWVSLRKVIPGETTGGYQQEFFYDCRVAALSITVPQMGLMTHELAFIGRVPKWKDGKPASGSGVGAFGQDFEDSDSIGQSAVGQVALSGFSSDELPDGGSFTHAQVILANQFSTPQEEMIIGSYYPDNFACLSRGAMVRLIYKWKDASLYRALNMAQADGTSGLREWTPAVRNSPVSIISRSPVKVPTFNNPYTFEFYAPGADWMMSPVTLAPRKLVQVEIIGTIKQAPTGQSTWGIDLGNGQTYTALKAM